MVSAGRGTSGPARGVEAGGYDAPVLILAGRVFILVKVTVQVTQPGQLLRIRSKRRLSHPKRCPWRSATAGRVLC